MSHFAVLVIGAHPEQQLAPFHEFECTGKNDQYVQDTDVTDEYRKDYEDRTKNRYVSPTGENFSPYSEQFYRDFTEEEMVALIAENGGQKPYGSGDFRGMRYTTGSWDDGKGYRSRIHFMPEGYTEQEFKVSELETFAEFVEGWGGQKVVPFGEMPDTDETHKYGYVLVDENGDVTKVVKRTNPNSKWDWYKIGGRWNGFYKLKDGRIGKVGKPGVMTEAPKEGYVDQVYKGDVDFASMRKEAEEKAAELYDKVMVIIGHLPVNETWDSVRDRMFDTEGRDAAIAFYHSQPRNKAIKECGDREMIWIVVDEFVVSREEYIKRAGDASCITFAIVKDGQWFERGEMGWWGVVTNESDRSEWYAKYNELLNSLSDDTLLTLVDCHI